MKHQKKDMKMNSFSKIINEDLGLTEKYRDTPQFLAESNNTLPEQNSFIMDA